METVFNIVAIESTLNQAENIIAKLLTMSLVECLLSGFALVRGSYHGCVGVVCL